MISIFIVTYRNPVDLNNNVASILNSGADVRINIINNHSEFFLEPEYESRVTVLHNNLRPNFSTGHLARNWNQALLHGFRDLRKPESDIVVTAQDDVVFKKDWLSRLIDLHRRYTFITMGGGDAFCSYRPEAIRKIGMWDERFCNIGFQEADYFLRAFIYNREDSSINDAMHGRLLNPVEGNAINPYLPATHPIHKKAETLNTQREEIKDNGMERAESMLVTLPRMNSHREDTHMSSMKFHRLTYALFKQKWGVEPHGWWQEQHSALQKSLIQNYITYPYFEKDIESLREKNYMVPDDFECLPLE